MRAHTLIKEPLETPLGMHIAVERTTVELFLTSPSHTCVGFPRFEAVCDFVAVSESPDELEEAVITLAGT